jgi:hypothetical protein
VDRSAIAFLCALEPQPLLRFDTKEPRADENGEPLYVVQLIALAEGEAEILAVKVPGSPRPGRFCRLPPHDQERDCLAARGSH